MNEKQRTKMPIRGAIRPDSPLLLAGAVLIIISGLLLLFLNTTPLRRVSWLMPSTMTSISAVATGVLLLMSRRRPELCLVSVIFILICPYLNMTWLIVVLMLLSAIGFKWNVAPKFLPSPVRVPVLNLAAILLALRGIAVQYTAVAKSSLFTSQKNILREAGLIPDDLMIFLLPALLLCVGLILLNLSAKAQLASTAAESREKRWRIKFVPKTGSQTFSLGAALLIIYSAASVFSMFQKGSVSAFSILWLMPRLAAGILLINPAWREKHYIAAVVLLLVNPAWQLTLPLDTAAVKLNEYLLLSLLPPVLMLISAIGVYVNASSDKPPAPDLNQAAACLLIIDIANTIAYNVFLYPSNAKLIGAMLINNLPLILLTISLILLNLSLTPQKVASQKVSKTGSTEYRKNLTGLVSWMYSDVGSSLRAVAKIQGIIFMAIAIIGAAATALGLVGFLLSGIAGGSNEASFYMIVGGLACVLAAMLGILLTYRLYAFGQITSDIHEIKLKGAMSGGSTYGASVCTVPSEENPDELPEL